MRSIVFLIGLLAFCPRFPSVSAQQEGGKKEMDLSHAPSLLGLLHT